MIYPTLTKEFPIHVYETDPDGKLSLYSLFDYYQDIASDHAVILGYGREELMRDNNFWVLSRMYTVISKWPRWGEKIIIRTWPRGTDKLFALRDFEARFTDGSLAARATSSWLILDYTTKRVKRPGEELLRLNHEPGSAGALNRNAEKIGPPTNVPEPGNPFSVKTSDLDINLHTNNSRYLKWVTDNYDLDFIMNNAPVSAEINYLAESRSGENVMIMTSKTTDDMVFDHVIIRPSDEKELCRLRIAWESNHSLM